MGASEDSKLRDMLEFIIREHGQSHVLTRTKLVKYAFLADARAKDILDRKISDTTYVYYHYGPYSDDIMDAIQELDGEFIEERSNRASVGQYYTYSPLPADSEVDLNRVEKEIIRDILDEYGGQDTESLVERVYDEYDVEDNPKYAELL